MFLGSFFAPKNEQHEQVGASPFIMASKGLKPLGEKPANSAKKWKNCNFKAKYCDFFGELQ